MQSAVKQPRDLKTMMTEKRCFDEWTSSLVDCIEILESLGDISIATVWLFFSSYLPK